MLGEGVVHKRTVPQCERAHRGGVLKRERVPQARRSRVAARSYPTRSRREGVEVFRR